MALEARKDERMKRIRSRCVRRTPSEVTPTAPVLKAQEDDPFRWSCTPPTRFERQVAELLVGRRGWRAAISLDELVRETGRDATEVRATVALLLGKHRMPIWATASGFYLAETREELAPALSGLPEVRPSV
jgi:hypothetical protein